MKKILFISTYGDFLATFEYSNIGLLINMGYEVHCASNFSEKGYNRKINRLDEIGVIKHDIDFERSPFKIKNIKIYKRLIELIKREGIDVIDCHNAVISVLARLAAKKCNVKKVIYTPHSFFFYEGCPIKNKLIYKNVETFLARYTDLLIGINKEDYEAARKMPIRGKALYVPGVGINVNDIQKLPNKRNEYCKEFGIPNNSIIFVSVGELIERKNHITALRAFAKANIKNSFYIICGFGELEDKLKAECIKLGIENRVIFTGFRLDAKEIMKASDIFIFPSYQEGLSVALMEAMACGIPCIVSKIRGNVDLIDEEKGGMFFSPQDVDRLANELCILGFNNEKRHIFGNYNYNKANIYDISNIQKIMRTEYLKLME